ncbi:hypothetical protein Pth03_58170 [Planotetraspora thailandica]|uniref:Uncharacterized protein n=1 Tax=Planotetraspora thailandica TaxID=487172 RepID=A0A8J3V664_9ACTN|nr:hypothetical protein [Planotetraspora thailandica]GII57428.1 hypothetical protein Pth03_58170 [Planotetraspora thailandica]
MHLAHYLRLLHRSQTALAEAFREIRRGHPHEPDMYGVCERLAVQCGDHARRVEPFVRRYEAWTSQEPERLHRPLFAGTRPGGLGLLRDLHDLYLLATECDIACTMIAQGARGTRDDELLDVVRRCGGELAVQLSWLRTRMRHAAPQALVVAT